MDLVLSVFAPMKCALAGPLYFYISLSRKQMKKVSPYFSLFLLHMQGTETVEGLVLKVQKTNRVCFNTDSFVEMKKLRLLQLECVDLTDYFGHLSKQLRWVNLQGFIFRGITDDFYQGNLVVIDLKYSNIKQVWKETKV